MIYSVVWEVHFHPSKPDHLFTCSEDGSLWHWDASAEVMERPSFLMGEYSSSKHWEVVS